MSERRVLIVRVGAMGDVVHALFAASALRKARPHWEIDWVVDERWAALLGADGRGPLVHHPVPVPVRAWKRAPLSGPTLRSVLALGTLRGNGDDPAVDLQGTMRSAVICRLAGARARCGWADPRERLARLAYNTAVERRGTHIVEQMTALLGDACGVALTPALTAELPSDERNEVWAAMVTRDAPRYALLCSSAGWGAKQWPAERFGALARALAARGFAPLLNAASTDDPAAETARLASQGSARTVVCGVGQLIALTRRAALVVGGDSGPVHLAAALRVPTVALFGPTDPARNGPWGSGKIRVLRHRSSTTSHKRVPDVEAGLACIGVREVLDAALAVVDGE